jgi:hypothetical protein
LFYPHEIVEDWESLMVATVEQLNWGNSIVSRMDVTYNLEIIIARSKLLSLLPRFN